MYKCKECGMGVMVTGLPKPVKMCDCKVKVTLESGEVIEKPAAIIMDMEATAYGRSQFKM